MAQPLSAPSAPTPLIHPANILGSPSTTIAAALAALAAYFTVNGDKFPPADTAGWAAFALGAAVAVLGAMIRAPGKPAA